MTLKINEKIDEKLNSINKTWYWLSKKSGISLGTLYPIKSGARTQITFSTMEKIADALDVSLDEFRTNK
ncbi:helix-turn-helix transcriptional regulator [Leuconostoc mesenteroides]|jgi:DNA-binding Xre family transcriptional regulator|uniref:helix-turn-helix domain-containing protein n=1 Tax=Leuconostoc mesenteroides TaxID=1245 RepID=UPI000E011B02|nr:helix-turn-helix transcriptional regulator [Leuconostoc mesenteroides]MCU4664259.1 helix-turn-helix transcriptional regulator [Leuconostoc mesenteroides]STY39704.1 Predicted transcriptional regulator [Leuconostoc mesenteroides]